MRDLPWTCCLLEGIFGLCDAGSPVCGPDTLTGKESLAVALNLTSDLSGQARHSVSVTGITACSHAAAPALTPLSPACSVQEWRPRSEERRVGKRVAD